MYACSCLVHSKGSSPLSSMLDATTAATPLSSSDDHGSYVINGLSIVVGPRGSTTSFTYTLPAGIQRHYPNDAREENTEASSSLVSPTYSGTPCSALADVGVVLLQRVEERACLTTVEAKVP